MFASISTLSIFRLRGPILREQVPVGVRAEHRLGKRVDFANGVDDRPVSGRHQPRPFADLCEWEVAVPPMALPDQTIDDLSALRSSDSFCLFVKRAQAIIADFGLTIDTLEWLSASADGWAAYLWLSSSHACA
ncbi:MAG TPA: hypothetical protein VGL99_06810 [Chloroflexota bacterium]